MVEIPKNEV